MSTIPETWSGVGMTRTPITHYRYLSRYSCSAAVTVEFSNEKSAMRMSWALVSSVVNRTAEALGC